MAAKILQGYLIDKVDYADNDEIITFLDTNSNKHTCISFGSRKIQSKNGRNLFLGNYCNFEFFESRNPSKMSRLKSCKAINRVDWRMAFFRPFNILCECVKQTQDNQYLYTFYKWMLETFVSNTYSEKELILIILHKFCLIIGLNLEINKCIECGNKIIKTISFKKHGMICVNHFNSKVDKYFDINFCKLTRCLFSSKYDEIKNYYQHFDLLISKLIEYIADNSGIFLKI